MIYFISPQTRLFEHTADIQESNLLALKHWFEGKLIDADMNDIEFIVELDTETTGFHPQLDDTLKCIQLGDSANQWVIDVMHSPRKLDPILLDILRDTHVTWLLANAKFDYKFFLSCNVMLHQVWDVFLAECLLTAGLRDTKEQKLQNGLGLDFLAHKYCEAILDKSIRGNIHREGLTDRVIKYAADDVKYLGAIRDKQLIELTKWDLLEVVKLENEVVKVFARMEYNGIYLDQTKWRAVAEITSKNTIDLELQLDSLVLAEPKLAHYVPRFVQSGLFDIGPPVVRPNIIWTSPTQKLRLLNSILPTPISSTDDKTLQKLKKEHVLVPVLVDHAKQSKLKSSFGHDFLKHVAPHTSRIYPDYWQILSTGRISASNPNVNQIPSKGELAKAIRAAFVARTGRKIVGGDYSGMELRIIAEFSKDPTWLQVFQNNGDLHTVLCCSTFDIPVSDVKQPFPPKPDWSYRDVQKTVGFGLAYGMSKFKLSGTVQISLNVADEIITKFFAACPKVEHFLTGLGELGKKRNYVRTAKPFGRPRFFYSTPSEEDVANSFGNRRNAWQKRQGEIERASKNHPIQGTNGDIIKLALVNTQKVIDDEQLDVQIMLSVYDEIQTDCEESIAPYWAKRLEDIMVSSAKQVLLTVPVVVDVKIANHWSK